MHMNILFLLIDVNWNRALPKLWEDSIHLVGRNHKKKSRMLRLPLTLLNYVFTNDCHGKVQGPQADKFKFVFTKWGGVVTNLNKRRCNSKTLGRPALENLQLLSGFNLRNSTCFQSIFDLLKEDIF